MKSFDDFLATLSSKDQEEIIKKGLSELVQTNEIFSEHEMKLAGIISQAAGLQNREMLRLYHNWLSEQMQ